MSTGTSRHSQPVKVKQNAKHFQPVEGSGMTDENFKTRNQQTHETLYKLEPEKATDINKPLLPFVRRDDSVPKPETNLFLPLVSQVWTRKGPSLA